MKITRQWAMPNAETFDIEPIKRFVNKYINGVIIDPFARNKKIGTYTNDLNPETSAEYHIDAVDFLKMLVEKGVKADVVLFDPPYSPRQIAECYALAGLKPTMEDTQSARFKAECRNNIRKLLKKDGYVLSFGWNTTGHGEEFKIEEILIVAHGGDHNDTLCMAEKRIAEQLTFLE